MPRHSLISEKNMKIEKKKGRIFRRILAGVLAVTVLFIGITTVITVIGLKANINKALGFPEAGSEQIKVKSISDGVWNIYSDDGLKVMQLTDTHFGGGLDVAQEGFNGIERSCRNDKRRKT